MAVAAALLCCACGPDTGGPAAALPEAAPAATAAPAAPAGRGPLAGRTVALDPGHNRDNARSPQTRRLVDAGGLRKQCNTTGTAAADGTTESAFAFDLAVQVQARLERLGAAVRLTRTADAGWGPCVDVRGRFGGRVHADVLVSLHADGAGPSQSGFHVIRTTRSPAARDSARLAVSVRDALVRAGFRTSDYAGTDGVDVRGDLGTLNLSPVPTVLVEAYNMRNPREHAQMRTPAGRARLAEALATGVVAHLTAPG